MTANHRRFSGLQLLLALAIAAMFAVGCAGGDQRADTTSEVEQPEERQQRPDPDFSAPPEGFSDVEILGVVTASHSPAVLLASIEREAMLPIFINRSQAMAIQLGLDQQDFSRPLTHDLVADIMDRLDGEIAKVQVDDLREGTFIATIYLITPSDVVEVDARPSDALALSAGTDIPIYVADHVIDQAGLTEEDVEDLPPADPGDPEDFDDSPTTPL